MQRRNQKIIEETPSPFINDKIRKKMCKASVDLCKAIGYLNAGTIEYLVDKDGKYYFMEMNTRIQVEHPVTEEITGIDIVRLQLEIAGGAKLPFTQDDIEFKGHAIECRINAEDPDDGFKPRPGTIDRVFVPGGRNVRWDSHIYAGYKVPPTYDSMVGKLIVWGEDREKAIERMRQALDELVGPVSSQVAGTPARPSRTEKQRPSSLVA